MILIYFNDYIKPLDVLMHIIAMIFFVIIYYFPIH